MLYLFLARQGIDQSPADSVGAYSRGGWEALFEAKGVLHYNYLADYCGARSFRRGLHDYLVQPERSLEALQQCETIVFLLIHHPGYPPPMHLLEALETCTYKYVYVQRIVVRASVQAHVDIFIIFSSFHFYSF
jgi:hypothetical protein